LNHNDELCLIVSQNANYAHDYQQDTPMEQAGSLAPKEPEPFEFSATMPAMSAQDL
jgi:splicing factor 3A subunit 1